MSALVRFLYPLAPTERSPGAVLRWWERRRVVYNVAVGAAGLTSLAVATLFGVLPPGGQLFRFPLIGIAVYGLLANLCYCGGWAIEMTLNRLWGEKVAPVGPVLFRQGLIFSVGLSLLPIIIAGLGWIARVFLALIH